MSVGAVYLSDKLHFFTTVPCSQLFLTGTRLHSWKSSQEERSLLWFIYGKMEQTWDKPNFQYFQNSPAKTSLALLGAATHKKYPPMIGNFHGKVGMMDSASRKKTDNVVYNNEGKQKHEEKRLIWTPYSVAVLQGRVTAHTGAGFRGVTASRLMESPQMRLKLKLWLERMQ